MSRIQVQGISIPNTCKKTPLAGSSVTSDHLPPLPAPAHTDHNKLFHSPKNPKTRENIPPTRFMVAGIHDAWALLNWYLFPRVAKSTNTVPVTMEPAGNQCKTANYQGVWKYTPLPPKGGDRKHACLRFFL